MLIQAAEHMIQVRAADKSSLSRAAIWVGLMFFS